MADPSQQPDRLVCLLMPGLDGTGTLFENFAAAAPAGMAPVIASYPGDEPLSYEQLAPVAAAMLPTADRCILVAESFSGPLALRVAADASTGLVGVVLCNTFIRPPLCGFWRYAPLATLARGPLPSPLLRRYLLGRAAPQTMVTKLRAAIRRVHPKVLAHRIRSVLAANAAGLLARCPVPILHLRARGDKLIPKRCLAQILAVRPDLTTRTLDGPHLLLQTHPHESWSALEAFAATLST